MLKLLYIRKVDKMKHKITAVLHSKNIYERKEDTTIAYCLIPIEPNDGKAISLMKYDIDLEEEYHKLIIGMNYVIEYDDDDVNTEDAPEMSNGLCPCTVDYTDSLSPNNPIDRMYIVLI
jgi:hypothetical protein